MSHIEVTSGPARPTTTSRSHPASGSAANTVLTWALLLLLVLSPLPFGSARPFFWTISATYIGVAAFLYFGFHLLAGSRPRIASGSLTVPAALSAVLCGFLLIQILPLGNWIGNFRIENFADAPLAASTISISPNTTWLMLLRQLAYAAFFMLMLQVVANRSRRNLVLGVILWSIVLYAIFGIVSLQTGDTILGIPKWAYLGSATGTFINRNSFATYLAFGGVLALAMFIGDFRKRRQPGVVGRALIGNLLLYGIAYAVLVMVVIATNSRMGLAVTLAGSLVVLASAAIHGGTGRRALLAILAAAAAVAIGALVYLGTGMVDRLGEIEGDALSRGSLYLQVWEMILSRPILGFGGGSFELAYPLFHRPPVDVDFIWNRSHNTYLALWSDLGLVIGSIPMVIIGYFAWRILRVWLHNRSAEQTGENWLAQTVALAIIVLSALHSLVDFSLEIPANTYVFLALVACGAASTFQMTRRVERPEWQ